ncbi:MAG: outer membrane protein assembly factor BamD [Candidatus Eisenbacteria bacterium]|nr:outer membrane protein assembly factor BamD [Candidatus Eisenbacteria bacterium]
MSKFSKVLRRSLPSAAGIALAALLAGCGATAGVVHYAPGEEAFVAGKELYQTGDLGECARALKAYLDATPGGPNAEEASYLIGVAYSRLGQHTMAQVELRHFLDVYPASPRLPEVEYQLALSYWEDSRPAAYDQEKTVYARAQVQRFLVLYPESPRVPDAKKLLEATRDRLAEKEVLNARLYTHLKQPGSVVFHAQKVLTEFADSPWAAEALYLKGLGLEEWGKDAEARQAWELLVKEKSGTEWAERAREKLARTALEHP